MAGRRDPARSDALDPIVSLGFVLTLKLSQVDEVRALLFQQPGIHVVYAKVAPPRSLWIEEGERP